MRGETVMRKLLRSCLGQTSWDRAACGAVALSGPVHSIWPVPHGSERATVTHTTQHNHFSCRLFNRWTEQSYWLLNCVKVTSLCSVTDDGVNSGYRWQRVTDPSAEDLVDSGTFLQRALGDDFSSHLFHVQHEGVQRFLYYWLLGLLLTLSFWMRLSEHTNIPLLLILYANRQFDNQ